jgi:hypothetical protein
VYSDSFAPRETSCTLVVKGFIDAFSPGNSVLELPLPLFSYTVESSGKDKIVSQSDRQGWWRWRRGGGKERGGGGGGESERDERRPMKQTWRIGSGRRDGNLLDNQSRVRWGRLCNNAPHFQSNPFPIRRVSIKVSILGGLGRRKEGRRVEC